MKISLIFVCSRLPKPKESLKPPKQENYQDPKIIGSNWLIGQIG